MIIKDILAKIWQIGGLKDKGRSYYDSILIKPTYDPTAPIEKSIHQTYHKKNDLPIEIEDNISSIKSLNPDYNYKLWDDGDITTFIQEHYGEIILGYYKRIAPIHGAARADFFRYLVIYKLGGIYLDIKSTTRLPLSTVIKESDRCLLAHWDNWEGSLHETFGKTHCKIEGLDRGEFIQWMLIYKAGHPLLREVILGLLKAIDTYNPFVQGLAQEGVLTTTGPVLYTKCIYPKLNSGMDYRLVEFSSIGLEYSIYEQLRSNVSHKSIIKNDYMKELHPVIPSKYSILNIIPKLIYKGYDIVLQRKNL